MLTNGPLRELTYPMKLCEGVLSYTLWTLLKILTRNLGNALDAQADGHTMLEHSVYRGALL